MNGDSANHSDDQKNDRKGEKHAHLRIGFPDLTHRLDVGPEARIR